MFLVSCNSPTKFTAHDNADGNSLILDYRTYEDISQTFSENNGNVHSLYSLELRQNPELQGKVVLELIIAPAGQVTECKIIFSELNSPDFESELIGWAKQLEFGERDVKTMVVTYPLEFFPYR